MTLTNILIAVMALVAPLAVQVSIQGEASASSPNDSDCPVAETVYEMVDVPAGLDVEECDLVGAVLDLGEEGVAITSPGDAAVSITEFVDGSSAIAEVSTSVDGSLEYDLRITDPADESEPPIDTDDDQLDPLLRIRADGCDFSGYSFVDGLLGSDSPRGFYIGDGAHPAGSPGERMSNVANLAAEAWYQEKSPCFSNDQSSPPALVSLGCCDSRESDLNLDDGVYVCSRPDEANTLDMGPLPYRTVARACLFGPSIPGLPDPVISFDIRLNDSKTWTYRPHDIDGACYHRDVRSVLSRQTDRRSSSCHTYR